MKVLIVEDNPDTRSIRKTGLCSGLCRNDSADEHIRMFAHQECYFATDPEAEREGIALAKKCIDSRIADES